MTKTQFNNIYPVSEMQQKEAVDTARLLAKSFCSNPIHLAIFKNCGEKAIRQQEKLFEFVLTKTHKTIFVAKDGEKIICVMCYTDSVHCQLKATQLMLNLPRMFFYFGGKLLSVLKWQACWSKHDLVTRHLHFGPIAVHPDYQDRGIGKMLITQFCKHTDAIQQTAYLETDKKDNVALYQKFGFTVTAQDSIFKVQNWYMVRSNSNQ